MAQSSRRPLIGLHRRDLQIGAHRLAAYVGGEDGETIVLVHGNPDSSALYRHQIPALVDAGYRVVAPDLLGLGDSEIPPEVQHYTVQQDYERLVAVIDQLGIDRFHLVGHDRGGPPSWAAAAMMPERVLSLVALSAGHSNAYLGAGYEQRKMSWYMLRLLFEDAEDWLRRDDWHNFRSWMRHHPEVDTWIADASRPGALTAICNWYRANVHPITSHWDPLPRVRVPVLGVWPDSDPYLGVEQMARSGEWVDGPWEFRTIEGAGHFLQVDRPEAVTAAILDWVRNHPAGNRRIEEGHDIHG